VDGTAEEHLRIGALEDAGDAGAPLELLLDGSAGGCRRCGCATGASFFFFWMSLAGRHSLVDPDPRNFNASALTNFSQQPALARPAMAQHGTAAAAG